MNESYVVAVNRGSIRIYQPEQPPGQTTPGYRLVQSLDVPEGRMPYNQMDTDQAGRFPSHPQQGGNYRGMSIDERLPHQREHEKRVIEEVARQVNGFLQAHPGAAWDFAAPPGVHQGVLEQLSPEVRDRIRRALTKDLTNLPAPELREHLAAR